MEDYLNITLGRDELLNLSSLALAHVGDGVYDLLVRAYLCKCGKATAGGLHRETVRRVSAPAQARAMDIIEPMLSDEELAVFRRARNTKVHFVPQNATRAQYHRATGLEALFGSLYLSGQHDRINELFQAITESNFGQEG